MEVELPRSTKSIVALRKKPAPEHVGERVFIEEGQSKADKKVKMPDEMGSASLVASQEKSKKKNSRRNA